jgi:hypothetical protein
MNCILWLRFLPKFVGNLYFDFSSLVSLKNSSARSNVLLAIFGNASGTSTKHHPLMLKAAGSEELLSHLHPQLFASRF